MSIPATGPVQPFITASPYSPLGKPPVGQESPDTKDKPLPPVEAAEAGARATQHRIGEDAEGSSGGEQGQRQPGEDTSAEQEAQKDAQSAVAPRELPARDPGALAAQMAMCARIGQVGHAAAAEFPDLPRMPVSGFAPEEPDQTGTLLDQTI